MLIIFIAFAKQAITKAVKSIEIGGHLKKKSKTAKSRVVM